MRPLSKSIGPDFRNGSNCDAAVNVPEAVYARSGHQAICVNVWVDAVECPIAVQRGIAERNKASVFRVTPPVTLISRLLIDVLLGCMYTDLSSASAQPEPIRHSATPAVWLESAQFRG